MICISISADSYEGLLRTLAEAVAEAADLHELRLDHLTELPNVEDLLAASVRPVLATCRAAKEGGSFIGTDAERRDILRRALAAGAAYIDAEPDDLAALRGVGHAIRIVSIHDFRHTPDDLMDRVAAMAANPDADWVKFAVMARKPEDNLTVFRAIAACPKPAIGIAMGDIGIISRVLGLRHGSRLTFGCLDNGMESAPGQPTARELAELYRVHSITEKTQIYGLLESHGPERASHATCNMAFKNLDMDAVCLPLLSGGMENFDQLLTVLDSLCLSGKRTA